jgi:ABC-type multidrug transport system fused ATPase/permease subunit
MTGMLAMQAVMPLVVERILRLGSWDTRLIALLGAIILTLILTGYLLERQAHTIASQVGDRMRRSIFAHVVRTRVLHQEGLIRPSIVSRHTSDVDAVTDAVESTLVSGLPGIIRLVQSLALLTLIEWRAGVAMTAASLIFLLVRSGVGRGLVVVDRARLDARSRVSEAVDESVSAARPVRGLRLGHWVQERVTGASAVLLDKSISQGRYLAQLSTAARAAGLAGMFLVVVFAVALGGTNLAGVAAALLYVEAVVRSLEALPPWVRELQMAVVSRLRIDQILNAPVDSRRPLASALPRDLAEATGRLMQAPLVGLVTGLDVEADEVLAVMADEVGCIHVTQEPAVFNLPFGAHLRALNPALTDDRSAQILDAVGLTGNDASQLLGPSGSALTVSERQRLTLAMALAAEPETLFLGPILAVRDTDGALELIRRVAADGPRCLVVSAATPEVAEAADAVVFVTKAQVCLGSHADLLVSQPEYSALWERRLHADQVDLSALGLGSDAESSLHARLVMERYADGDIVYREGDPADRVIFVAAGRLEILTGSEETDLRRVAVLGPGNHCGDLRLTVRERRAETVRCLESAVVRSLSREAISAGMMGLLDRSPAERRIVTALLRSGAMTPDELRDQLPDLDGNQFDAALALLIRDGAVSERGGRLSTIHRRSTKAGVADILDRIGGAE